MRATIIWLAVGLAFSAPAAEGQHRSWTVADSIERVRFSSRADGWDVASGEGVFYSPSRKHFAVIATRGDLQCDCNISTLIVYDADEVAVAIAEEKSTVAPQSSIEFYTRSAHFLPIEYPVWINDRDLVFLGRDRVRPQPGEPASPGQVYLYNADERSVTNRSQMPLGDDELNPRISAYVTNKEATLYVTTQNDPDAPPPYPARYLRELDMTLVHQRNLSPNTVQSLILANANGRRVVGTPISFQGGFPRHFIVPAWMPEQTDVALVGVATARETPGAWSGYDAAESYGSDAAFRILSLESGAMRTLIDAPYGTATEMGRERAYGGRGAHVSPQILYGADGSAVLVNAALPLDPVHPERRKTAYLVALSPNLEAPYSLAALVDQRGSVASVRMNPARDCLIVTRELDSGERRQQLYENRHGRWRLIEACRAIDVPLTNLSVQIEESQNSPPAVVARMDDRSITLVEREARFSQVAFAPTREISWREEGQDQSGGLVLPDARFQAPYPLVIQIYYYRSDRFNPDGVFPSFSAQAFADAGMAVLNVSGWDHSDPSINGSPREGPAMVSRVDAAVARLVADGLVDPGKVGLLGFSRGGYLANYVSAFPGAIKPAAGIADSSFDAGFQSAMWFMYQRGGTDFRGELGNLGGRPFWLDKENWLRNSPTLNFESLRTPMLFGRTGNSPVTMFSALDYLAAARTVGAPIEIVQYPYRSHMPNRPRERQALIGIHTDWFRFWLQDYEDPDPTKRDTYARWREMRESLSNRSDGGPSPATTPLAPEGGAR